MDSEERAGSAIVFPGMGPARFADVGRFMVANPFARRLVAAADEALGYSLVDRYREAEMEGAGEYSEYAQVAFLVNCLALAQWAEERLELAPDVCVGPSFGLKAATAYVGALPYADVVRMTAELARCMHDYFSREHQDVVTLSFVRTPRERLDEILGELSARGDWHDLSCHIDHDFYMLSLREGSVEWLEKRVRSVGGLPLYTMRPPMHCAAFGPLRRRVEQEVLSRYEFTDPTLTVVSDQDGSLVGSSAGIRELLLDGLVRPVRWPDAVATLRGLGVGTVHVCGQDRLFGRVACTTDNFGVVALNPELAMRPRRRTAAPVPAMVAANH